MGASAASRRILITGGAGFIGSSIGIGLMSSGFDGEVTAVDNLKRRGSELNLSRLGAAGVSFVHADVRDLDDLLDLDRHDVLIECSAEPSVLAGLADTRYVYKTNLEGAYNCLELARRDEAELIFLSTSRVYPLAHLNSIRLTETDSRFEIATEQKLPGVCPDGIAESFPLDGSRTFYGATKLAAELLIAEYREAYGLRATVNRCGAVAGPWQMGKVDQGVFTHWVLCHYFRRPLAYIGFGGTGKQVRDLMHVADLVALVLAQVEDGDRWDGVTVNVGGGREGSLSLLETTQLCQELTGNRLEVESVAEDRPGDVPVYLSDCSALGAIYDWGAIRPPRAVLEDIYAWVHENEPSLKHVLQ